METWLLGYAIFLMFHRIEWLESWLALLPWFLLLLLALALYFRTQMAAARRRLVTAFE